MKITDLNDSALKMLRVALEQKAKEIEAEYGVKLKFGNITYNSSTFRLPVTGSVLAKAQNGVVVDPRREAAAKMAFRGLGGEKRPDKIISSYAYVQNLGRCQIVDFNTRAKNYPVIVRPDRLDGQYRTSVYSIQSFEVKE
jgi:hypothetical protein